MRTQLAWLWLIAAAVCFPAVANAQTTQEILEKHLIAGDLDAARTAMDEQLKANPDDSQAQLGLGLVTTFESLESLSQKLYRYGLEGNRGNAPFLRMPVPANKNPEPITYEKWNALLQEFVDDLDKAEAALKLVKDDDVKLKLSFSQIRFDMDGDGEVTERERLWLVMANSLGAQFPKRSADERYDIGVDMADVHWLIGYTHVLRGGAEMLLAYDMQEIFEFAMVRSFNEEVPFPEGVRHGDQWESSIFEAVMAIHLASFELKHPEKMQAAHAHFKQVVAESRLMWKYAEAETDDDREWIPNSKQTNMTPLPINQEQIIGWRLVLDQVEAVLDGKKLVPHWRLEEGYGLNIKKIFQEPRDFDIVKWAYAAEIGDYIEKGDIVTANEGRDLNQMFQGRFWRYAFWIN